MGWKQTYKLQNQGHLKTEEKFSSITKEDWASMCNHVLKIEKENILLITSLSTDENSHSSSRGFHNTTDSRKETNEHVSETEIKILFDSD